MKHDISTLLNGWDFRPHELNVRIIKGDDGLEKIQMRIDLGLLQMTMDGRPDGDRPFECESLLEHYESEAAGVGDGYQLPHEALDDLFREAWQYYHRYLCLFHLANYKLVVRDTERNLRLFAFVRKHAKRRRDRWRFDQARPFVLMMCTRARAMMSLAAGERSRALKEIDAGCKRIEDFLREYDRLAEKADFFELQCLVRWRHELMEQSEPISCGPEVSEGLESLQAFLKQAVDREDYEFAALIRDKIQRLTQQSDSSPRGEAI